MLPQQPLITGRRHMVVAGHYLATEAGLKILEAGVVQRLMTESHFFSASFSLLIFHY